MPRSTKPQRPTTRPQLPPHRRKPPQPLRPVQQRKLPTNGHARRTP